jgi:protein ImuA
VLAVMEEGLHHGGLAAVVGEVGRVTMTATRRLQLAAEVGGTMALMLKRWRKAGEDPLALPSAAVTRWRLSPAPSERLSVPGIARARWRLELAASARRTLQPHSGSPR